VCAEQLEKISRMTNYNLSNLLDLEATKIRNELFASDQKYSDPLRLNKYEFEIFSQCGEDGVINEIFKRIGITNQHFAEFGAGNGLQNSTAALILKNWTGAWIESDKKNIELINAKYNAQILRHRLILREAFITTENIEELLNEMDIPQEFDLMSIDIDGNDYWVWKAIVKFKPRVVICEYNGRFGADLKWVMRYNASHTWNGSSYYGASLKSLEILGAQKGYSLVGCNLAGVNAFFVRNDLVEGKFATPFTSENHFEPQRHFLIRDKIQRNDFGPFETI
jgi:hypothetical protein